MNNIHLSFIDLVVPLILGIIYIFINPDRLHDPYLYLFLIYSITIVLISISKNFYNNYFLTNISEKLKITFVTSFFAIFIQMLISLYYSINIDFYLFLIWILIPISIILVKYLVRLRRSTLKHIMIIGQLYKFNDYEIKTLINKNFKVYFFDDINDLLISKEFHNNDILIVINFEKNSLVKTKEINDLVSTDKTISLNRFMEEYLRKLYITNDELIIDLSNYDRFNYVMKIIIDYSLSIILIPIFIIVFIWMIIMKFLKRSHEPILYKQQRYGINKEIFTLFKVRTMYINSENEGNTKRNDDRVYPFARILRKYRLDELPQIINVILGHMHLVGPRAEWVKLSDNYYKNISNYSLRHIVKPGVTGWAQIMYPYGLDENDAKQKLMYELYYIKNWSIWLELEICIRTLFVILDKRGF